MIGLICLQGCDAPPDDGDLQAAQDASTSTSLHDAAPGDEDEPDAGGHDDGGTGRDRDAGAEPDAAAMPSDGDSTEPANEGVTITRTLPDRDRVYVNATVRIQFVVEGISDAEIDLVVRGKTVARLGEPYRYDLDTRALAEGETTLTGFLHGQHSVASEPLELVIDRTAPVVVERAPAPNAPSVWVREPMGLTFSEPIVAKTVTASSVRVATDDEALIDAALSVADDGESVAITLEELPPALPATVTVSATDAIADLAGNALTPDSWSFEIPQWAESPGAPDGDDDPIGFAFTITEAGEQFVAWVDDDNVVRAARRTHGAWKAMPAWPENDEAMHDLVGIALTEDEQPVVAYIHEVSAQNDPGLPHCVGWDGSAWQDLGSPPADDTYQGPLFLRRDPSGGAPLLMVGGTASSGGIWRVDDSGWTGQAGGSGGTTAQSLAVLPNGDFLVGTKGVSECAVSQFNGNASTPLGAPLNATFPCVEAHVAAHPDGTPWLVTTRSGSSSGPAAWRYRLNNDGPSPAWVDIPAVFTSSDPDDVAFDPDGNIFMISRGSAYVSGMVLVDWSEENGQVIGNWTDAAEARFAFYGHVPAVVLLRDVTGSSPTRKFDIAVALRNQL